MIVWGIVGQTITFHVSKYHHHQTSSALLSTPNPTPRRLKKKWDSGEGSPTPLSAIQFDLKEFGVPYFGFSKDWG